MSKVTIKNTKKEVNDLVLVLLLLSFNIYYTFSSASIVDFEQVDVSWVKLFKRKKATVK